MKLVMMLEFRVRKKELPRLEDNGCCRVELVFISFGSNAITWGVYMHRIESSLKVSYNAYSETPLNGASTVAVLWINRSPWRSFFFKFIYNGGEQGKPQ